MNPCAIGKDGSHWDHCSDLRHSNHSTAGKLLCILIVYSAASFFRSIETFCHCFASGHFCVLQAKEHGYIPTDLKYASVGMLLAAFLPPAPRVLGFAAGIGVIIAFHYGKIMNVNLISQLALYLIGGISFLR